MHGLIHVIFKGFMVDNFGEESWKAVLKRADVEDETTILQMKQYDDDLTFAAVTIATELANVPLCTALELFGEYFVGFAAKEGFLRLIKSLGKSVFEVITNLNILHHNIERDFATSIFPLIEATSVKGAPEDAEHTFRLMYGSTRPKLHPLLKGALKKTAKVFFDATIEMQETASDPESFPDIGEALVEQQFLVTVRRNPTAERSPFREADLPPALPEKKPMTAPTLGVTFFDFHEAIAAIWRCNCIPVCNAAGVVATEKIADPALLEVHEQLRSKQTQIDELLTGGGTQESAMSPGSKGRVAGELGKHPYFKLSPGDRMRVGYVMFRSVEAKHISAPWTDKALEDAAGFWQAYTKLDMFYALSEDFSPAGQCKVRFLSQSWGVPVEWDQLFSNSYAEAKAAELCCTAKEIAAQELNGPEDWRKVKFWLDKCCIPQGDRTLMNWCVNLLEEFVVLSDGLIVLSPWTYFKRLWCVYEWVCFLLVHMPTDIEIRADPFMRDNTLHLYLDAINEFRLDSCECFHEADKAILFAKVAHYYKSKEAFESFFKFTAIALFARCVATRRSAKALSALQPWQRLAAQCGFDDLADKIGSLAVFLHESRTTAVGAIRRMSTRGNPDEAGDAHTSPLNDQSTFSIQSRLHDQVNGWFRSEIEPDILRERQAAATEDGLAYIETLKEARKLYKTEVLRTQKLNALIAG